MGGIASDRDIGEAVLYGVDDPVAARLDDRRAHVRAWERWVGLLQGRACPAIQDMDSVAFDDPNSLLLDLRPNRADPAFMRIGSALLRDCGGAVTTVSAAPRQSLLARLAGHYPVVLAIGEPMAFEGEHLGEDGVSLLYRGILLPLSSAPGGLIDLVHGLIHWRELADSLLTAEIAFEVGRSFGSGGGASAFAWDEEAFAAVAAMREPGHPELPFGI